jgi:hypothetical protein
MDNDKPKGVEGSIQDAIQRGDFDNLKGKGKPLDLNEYFDTPEDIRVGYSLLKNAGYVPEEVDLLRQISELKTALTNSSDANERQLIQKKLRDAQLKYDLRMERLKGK